MNTTITIDVLNPSSIQAAIRELNQYRERIQRKTVELRRRVAELIRNNADPVFQTAVADNRFNVIDGNAVDDTQFGGVTVTVQDNGDVTLVIASGKDVVFMEFGAGVYYNGSVGSSPHPLGAGLGYTIGSYGHGQGARNTWGFTDANGDFHLSHGVPASMPLYKAVMSVRQDIVQIAREVFST